MRKLDVTFGRPVECMNCPRTTLFDNSLPPGWIAETWATENGNELRIVLCPLCRNYLHQERIVFTHTQLIDWVDRLTRLVHAIDDTKIRRLLEDLIREIKDSASGPQS